MTEAFFHLNVALVSTESVIFTFGAVVASVGLLIAVLAYQGYRRNGSRPMLYLAIAIVLLTTVPVGIDYGMRSVTMATEAEVLLAVTVSHLVGILTILYALTRA